MKGGPSPQPVFVNIYRVFAIDQLIFRILNFSRPEQGV